MQSPLETNCQDHIPTGVFHLRLGDGRRRRGFTLLELMLVLAVIVVVTAMAAPALYRPLQNYKLKKGADHVRAIMGKAQLRAIKSGQVQVMLFLPGSGDLLVQTYATDQDIIEFSPQSVAGMQPATTIAPMPTLLPLAEKLPEGVTFVVAQTTGDLRDQLTQQSSLQGAAMDSTMLTSAGIPLMFYPDGTSTTARLILTNGLDAFVVLDLRGLTGVAQVSDLLRAEELGDLQ